MYNCICVKSSFLITCILSIYDIILVWKWEVIWTPKWIHFSVCMFYNFWSIKHVQTMRYLRVLHVLKNIKIYNDTGMYIRLSLRRWDRYFIYKWTCFPLRSYTFNSLPQNLKNFWLPFPVDLNGKSLGPKEQTGFTENHKTMEPITYVPDPTHSGKNPVRDSLLLMLQDFLLKLLLQGWMTWRPTGNSLYTHDYRQLHFLHVCTYILILIHVDYYVCLSTLEDAVQILVQFLTTSRFSCAYFGIESLFWHTCKSTHISIWAFLKCLFSRFLLCSGQRRSAQHSESQWAGRRRICERQPGPSGVRTTEPGARVRSRLRHAERAPGLPQEERSRRVLERHAPRQEQHHDDGGLPGPTTARCLAGGAP